VGTEHEDPILAALTRAQGERDALKSQLEALERADRKTLEALRERALELEGRLAPLAVRERETLARVRQLEGGQEASLSPWTRVRLASKVLLRTALGVVTFIGLLMAPAVLP
jgi:septal ring factor EnvC (AmiA/AmiB activator)